MLRTDRSLRRWSLPHIAKERTCGRACRQALWLGGLFFLLCIASCSSATNDARDFSAITEENGRDETHFVVGGLLGSGYFITDSPQPELEATLDEWAGDIKPPLDKLDRRGSLLALGHALAGAGEQRSARWTNRRSGRSGLVRTGPVYSVNLLTCRNVRLEFNNTGHRTDVSGVACRHSGGGWQTAG